MFILIEIEEIPILRNLIIANECKDIPYDPKYHSMKVDSFIADILEWLLDPENIGDEEVFSELENAEEIKELAEQLLSKLIVLFTEQTIIKSIRIVTQSTTLIELEEDYANR